MFNIYLYFADFKFLLKNRHKVHREIIPISKIHTFITYILFYFIYLERMFKMTETKTITAATQATQATATPTEVTSDFINKHFTAYKVAIDDTKSLTLYKLKSYEITYIQGISSLTVYIKTSDAVMQYLENRLKQALKASSSQAALQNWQSYYKPLQELAFTEYKKVYATLDTITQFDLSCGGQVILISPNYHFIVRKNIFLRPALQVSKDNKKTMQAALNKHLTALQNALLSDTNAKIKKQITNVLALWQYAFAWQAVNAEGIKLLKNLGCLQGAKGNRHNQSKTTLLNKVIECVYTQREIKNYLG